MLAGLVGAQGIVAAGDLAVAQHSTPNMSVDIAAGAVWVKGTENSLQGFYHCFNDALATVVVAASDPTNPRIDRVVAKVQDAFYSGATNAWSLAVVTGTPTAGATLVNLNGVGAAPNNSVTLAYALVPATATTVTNANISDQRTKATLATAAGGTLGYAQVTANQGPTAPPFDLTGLSVTVNVGSGRRIRITGQVLISSSVGTDTVGPQIFEDGVGVHYTQAPQNQAAFTSIIRTPSAGTHTYKLTAIRIAGTGNLTNTAAPTGPISYILVEDIGV